MSQNEITQAEITASIIEGRGQSTFAGATKVISLRLPITLEAELQAFAHKSGKRAMEWLQCFWNRAWSRSSSTYLMKQLQKFDF